MVRRGRFCLGVYLPAMSVVECSFSLGRDATPAAAGGVPRTRCGKQVSYKSIGWCRGVFQPNLTHSRWPAERKRPRQEVDDDDDFVVTKLREPTPGRKPTFNSLAMTTPSPGPCSQTKCTHRHYRQGSTELYFFLKYAGPPRGFSTNRVAAPLFTTPSPMPQSKIIRSRPLAPARTHTHLKSLRLLRLSLCAPVRM